MDGATPCNGSIHSMESLHPFHLVAPPIANYNKQLHRTSMYKGFEHSKYYTFTINI